MAKRLARCLLGRTPAQRKREEQMRAHPWLTGAFFGMTWMTLSGVMTGFNDLSFVKLPVGGFIYGLSMVLILRWHSRRRGDDARPTRVDVDRG